VSRGSTTPTPPKTPSVFSLKNCDGTPTPDEQLASASASHDKRVSDDQIQCGDGYEDFCEAAKRETACWGSATTLALSQYSVPFSATNTATDVAQGATRYASNSLAAAENRAVHDTGVVYAFRR
jgi:hypothetical protein